MKPFDLQVNGYAGTDFCSLGLTAEQLHNACRALEEDQVDSILATVITDTVDNLVSKLSKLVRFREQDPLAKKMIAGFHIEGPFLNPANGYIGAHCPKATKMANVDDTKRLLEAAGGLVRLFTLAPEMDAGFQTVRYLAEQKIVVSAGHTDASLDELRGAIDQGLSMATHLGNGCPVDLCRDDNIIQRVLHLRDHLWICFIPDGIHINFFTLKNYLDFLSVDRVIVVTDAISASRLASGTYEISGMKVAVDENGAARRPGSPNLAGSTLTMPRIVRNLTQELGLNQSAIAKLIDLNPREALGLLVTA